LPASPNACPLLWPKRLPYLKVLRHCGAADVGEHDWLRNEPRRSHRRTARAAPVDARRTAF